MKNIELWERLKNFQVRDKDDDYSFIERVSVENNWSFDYAFSVYQEYLKFIYLHCISSVPVTPSDEIDQVWHLHLVYTHSYWHDLCQNILGTDIHHMPTRGGANENTKFLQFYKNTIQRYKEEFGSVPPDDVWPDPEKRFGKYLGFKRIDTNTNLIINHSTIRNATIVSSLSLSLAACSLEEIDTNVLIFGVVIVVIFVLIKILGGKSKGGGGCSSAGNGCSSSGSGCCSSGGGD